MWALVITICLLTPDGDVDHATCEHADRAYYEWQGKCIAVGRSDAIKRDAITLAAAWQIRRGAHGAQASVTCRLAQHDA